MELRKEGHGNREKATGTETRPSTHDLKICDVMSKDVVTALPGDSVHDALEHMSQSQVSCLVVTDGERVIGVLSEKDVLRAVSGPPVDLRRITIAQTMSSPVQSVTPDVSVLKAGRIMQARQIRRLPVLDGKHLVGIVTQTDITRGLITLIPLTSICAIMTREVATLAENEPVTEAARIMASRRISCVVVMRNGGPVGVLTEKDVIHRVVRAHRNPSKTRVGDVMSSPITTVPPEYSVLGVSRKMDALHLHRLIVMDEGKLCGIITQTDIMRAIRAELERVEIERWGWMTELATQVQNTMEDLRKLQQLIQKLSSSYRTSDKRPAASAAPAEDQRKMPGRTVAASSATV
ncbi:MAG: CBS domain-containing protein [Sedimentisphaerales bacterium]|nr:CBS domain-containing protein [Sedimentisphaerales bacterium]